MADFRKDNRNSGGYRSGGNRGGRGGYGNNRGGRGDRQMHQATCSKCGKDCQVPFRPSGDKPIYCNDCFDRSSDRGGRSDDRRPSRGGARSSSPDYSKQFDVLNRKLDTILELLEGVEIIESEDDEEEGVEVSDDDYTDIIEDMVDSTAEED